ncbi:MAG: hypothetical protein ACREPQ_00690 [Rhodanobacter sp.]
MADPLKALEQTSRLLYMRDVMRTHWGDQYPVRIAEWQTAITNVAKAKQITPLAAAILLAKEAEGSSFAVIALMAAVVELEAPSDGVQPSPSERAAA